MGIANGVAVELGCDDGPFDTRVPYCSWTTTFTLTPGGSDASSGSPGLRGPAISKGPSLGPSRSKPVSQMYAPEEAGSMDGLSW